MNMLILIIKQLLYERGRMRSDCGLCPLMIWFDCKRHQFFPHSSVFIFIGRTSFLWDGILFHLYSGPVKSPLTIGTSASSISDVALDSGDLFGTQVGLSMGLRWYP